MCVINLYQARTCGVNSMWKQGLWLCLLCRGHWFLRCSCPFAPHTNAAGATPALVTSAMSHCGRTAGTNKSMALPNKMSSLSHALCLPATSPCWVPSSKQCWVKLQVFLSHYSMQAMLSGNTASPELQRLPHLSSYFSLLQLVFFFISSFCLIQVAVWYLYFTDVYKHYSSQCHKHIICIYTHIFIMTRACRTVCISKQWYYQKLAISF